MNDSILRGKEWCTWMYMIQIKAGKIVSGDGKWELIIMLSYWTKKNAINITRNELINGWKSEVFEKTENKKEMNVK